MIRIRSAKARGEPRAARVVAEEGPRFVNGRRHGGVGQQALEVGRQLRVLRRQLHIGEGVEEGRRGGAVGEAEAGAGQPLAACRRSSIRP